MKSKPRRLLQATAATALLLAAGHTADSHLRYNRTPSVPPGLYWLTHTPTTERGQYIAFCPPLTPWSRTARARGYLRHGECPGTLSALLKVVAAVPGDHVDVSADGIRINGTLWPQSALLNRDTRGRPLPRSGPTSYVVPRNHFLALSENLSAGFDGRYFGPTPIAQAQGTATRIP